MEITIGIRIPNVPQAVPVANESNAAMMKMIGASVIIGIPELATASATKFACSKVITAYAEEIVHANVRIVHAGIIVEDTLTNAAE